VLKFPAFCGAEVYVTDMTRLDLWAVEDGSA
jgi:hypothetical protein